MSQRHPFLWWTIYNYFFFLKTIFLGVALGVVIVFCVGIAHAPSHTPHIHRLQFTNFDRLYLPGPDVNNATAVTNSINGICICIHTRPIEFIATSIIITINSDAKRVIKPSINNAPASISATTTIQNHAVRDKNVRPIACAAHPTNGAISAAIGIFIIPPYKNNPPTNRRMIKIPSDLWQQVFILCININKGMYVLTQST